MLKKSYYKGANDACIRYKLAGTLGADHDVMPPGTEQSHGTDLIQYPPRFNSNPPPGGPYDIAARIHADDAVDKLWNSTDYDSLAPGGASDYGNNPIG